MDRSGKNNLLLLPEAVLDGLQQQVVIHLPKRPASRCMMTEEEIVGITTKGLQQQLGHDMRDKEVVYIAMATQNGEYRIMGGDERLGETGEWEDRAYYVALVGESGSRATYLEDQARSNDNDGNNSDDDGGDGDSDGGGDGDGDEPAPAKVSRTLFW
jgi:hypothetical protein